MNLTALILTFNEAANIRRTLEHLSWVPVVVLLDSGSTDATREIAETFPNVVWHHRPFDTHTRQWNYGLQETGITSEWILALDADYRIPPALAEEIQQKMQQNPKEDGFWMSFKYAIEGKEITSGIYPPVLALFRKEKAVYRQDGHTQKLDLDGKKGHLKHYAVHDDRKSMSRWLRSQWNYAQLEAEKLIAAKPGSLRRQDRIRLRWKLSPFLVFLYCYVRRSGWKDGIRGWQYAWQRTLAEILLQYCLLQQRSRQD